MAELLIELSRSPFSLAIANSSWVVPTMQSIHIIALCVVFISVLTTSLRVMGLAWGGVSIRQTADRFATPAWVALGFLAVTGLVLTMAEPIRELMTISFWIKMALLAALITVSIRFLRRVRQQDAFAETDSKGDAPMRRMAATTIAIVTLIIFMGRLIAYDILIWGAASPIASIYAG